MNYRSYQIVLRVKHLYTNRERCELLTGYWGASLAVTGRICDIGQNVLQYYSKQEEVAVLIYFYIFLIICRIPRGGFY
jgi:hypothetical protein